MFRLTDAAKVGIETDLLDSAPERAESEPSRAVIVDKDSRIDGIPIVTSRDRAQDHAAVSPSVIGTIAVERLACSVSDDGAIFAEIRDTIEQVPYAAMPDDVWGPDMHFSLRELIDHPVWESREARSVDSPESGIEVRLGRCGVEDRMHLHDTMASAEDIDRVTFDSNGWVVGRRMSHWSQGHTIEILSRDAETGRCEEDGKKRGFSHSGVKRE